VLNANANYILSFTDQLRPTSPPIVALDTAYRPLSFRVRGQLGWNRRGWSANLFVNHTDDYRDTRGGRSLPIGSFTTLDLGIAYEFGPDSRAGWLRNTRIAFSADNLLDREPPRLLPDPGSTSGLGYDPVNASGRGRFVSFQLRRTW
jgi:iron complex outermembrane receptor protein